MADSLPLLISHSLPSYCSPFTSWSCSVILPVVQYLMLLAPGVFSEEEQRLLADDSWPPELRDELVHQLRHLLSLNAPSAMHGFVHDQCENFSFFCIFGFMHDQCESLRDGESVRERADFDPTVPPPHPICFTIQSTRFATLKLNLPKSHGVPSDGRKTHKRNSWRAI